MLFLIYIFQFKRKINVIFKLIQRTSGIIEKLPFFLIRSFAIAFNNIGRNGNGAPSYLRNQTEHFLSRKCSGNQINLIGQIIGFLKNNQFSIAQFFIFHNCQSSFSERESLVPCLLSLACPEPRRGVACLLFARQSLSAGGSERESFGPCRLSLVACHLLTVSLRASPAPSGHTRPLLPRRPDRCRRRYPRYSGRF